MRNSKSCLIIHVHRRQSRPKTKPKPNVSGSKRQVKFADQLVNHAHDAATVADAVDADAIADADAYAAARDDAASDAVVDP